MGTQFKNDSNILYDDIMWIYVIIHLSKATEWISLRLNSKVNYDFG